MSALDPPDNLSADERAVWLSAVQQIMEAGQLDRIDTNGLAAYVSAVISNRRAAELLRASDVLIDRDGRPAVNPALAVQQQTAQTIATFDRQFRLNYGRTQPAPERPAPAGGLRDQDVMQRALTGGARWCEQHSRWECVKQRKAGRGQCHGPAVKDASGQPTERCRIHDGRHTADRLADVLVRERTYGEPVKVSAEQALLGELWRTAGIVKWLGERVAELEADTLTWGAVSTARRYWGEFPGSETIERAGPHVLLDLYYRERQHLVKVAAQIMSHGLAARMVDAMQEQGVAFAKCIDAILHDLDLSDEQWQLVPAVVPSRLRELIA